MSHFKRKQSHRYEILMQNQVDLHCKTGTLEEKTFPSTYIVWRMERRHSAILRVICSANYLEHRDVLRQTTNGYLTTVTRYT